MYDRQQKIAQHPGIDDHLPSVAHSQRLEIMLPVEPGRQGSPGRPPFRLRAFRVEVQRLVQGLVPLGQQLLFEEELRVFPVVPESPEPLLQWRSGRTAISCSTRWP